MLKGKYIFLMGEICMLVEIVWFFFISYYLSSSCIYLES